MAESIAIRERDNHMSVYRAKLLELLSVEKEHNQSYLKIKLSYDQEIELFWEIDNHTADHLVPSRILCKSIGLSLELSI